MRDSLARKIIIDIQNPNIPDYHTKTMVSKLNWNLKSVLAVAVLTFLGAVLFTQSGADLGKSVLGNLASGVDLKEVDFLKDGLAKEVTDYVRENAKKIPVVEGYHSVNVSQSKKPVVERNS